MSATIHKLTLPGTPEEAFENALALKPKRVLILLWDENDECSFVWNRMSLTDVCWAHRCLGIRLDAHINLETDDWTNEDNWK